MQHAPPDYANVVEALSVGVVVHGADGRPLACNPAAARLLGLSRAQILEQAPLPTGWRILREDGSAFPAAAHPALAALASGRAQHDIAVRVSGPDAARTWLAIDATPLVAEGGSPTAVIVTYTDITSHKLAEAALLESETRFRQLAENIDIVFWVGTPTWDEVLYVSTAYERIWGRSRASLYAQPMSWLEPIQSDDRQILLDVLRKTDDSDWQCIAFPDFRIARPDGGLRWVSARIYPIRDERGTLIRLAGVAEDISERLEQQRRLEELAHYDLLTHLPNRTLLADRMRQAMARGRRNGQMLAVCLLDLDGFKSVNDEFGHAVGDALLVELAGRMLTAVRADDTVARLGGDEFVLLLGGIATVMEAEDILARILKVVARTYAIQGKRMHVSASIGITLYPNDDADADTLLRHADHAMYLAKEAGKNRYRLFNPALTIKERENHNTLERIREAIHQDQLHLRYQPIVDSRQGRVVAVEALLRWDHPLLGLLNPREFLPLIDQHPGLAREIGAWVFEEAASQAERWRVDGLDLGVHINVFAHQIGDDEFPNLLEQLLARHPGLPADKITLEITESLLDDIAATKRLIEDNRRLGIRYALDDFGTGHASLARLRRLPVHAIKIDHAFVRDMLDDAEDLAVVEAIVGLAEAFRLQAIAEEVETAEQILILEALGCRLVQGYAIARPMPADEVAGWVGRFHPDPLWQGDSGQRLARDDVPLVLAEVRHRQWYNQLDAWLRQDPARRGEPPPLDARQCSFGQWYYGEKQGRYSHLEVFKDIESIHERIHAAAHALVEASERGDENGPLGDQTELQRLRDAFIAALARIRKIVGRRDEER